jgi:hypothetical protein
MKPTEDMCVNAIITYLKQRPGHVYDQFVVEGVDEYVDKKDFELPALIFGNWHPCDGDDEDTTVQCFDCEPFDAQLRAYVTEGRSGDIMRVEVVGE